MTEPPIIPPANEPGNNPSDPAWGPPNPNYPPPQGQYTAPQDPYAAGGYPPPPPPGYPPPPGQYGAPPPGQYPPGYAAPPVAGTGISDTAAAAISYITIIPAIIFLVMAPYNSKPFIRFHCFQSLGLGVVWFCISLIAVIPVLGWAIWLLGSLALLVGWVLCIIKASQGTAFKLPVIGDFAAQQSGYSI